MTTETKSYYPIKSLYIGFSEDVFHDLCYPRGELLGGKSKDKIYHEYTIADDVRESISRSSSTHGCAMVYRKKIHPRRGDTQPLEVLRPYIEYRGKVLKSFFLISILYRFRHKIKFIKFFRKIYFGS